jgi:hypothetical protein
MFSGVLGSTPPKINLLLYLRQLRPDPSGGPANACNHMACRTPVFDNSFCSRPRVTAFHYPDMRLRHSPWIVDDKGHDPNKDNDGYRKPI